jgi:hypothetical protein
MQLGQHGLALREAHTTCSSLRRLPALPCIADRASSKCSLGMSCVCSRRTRQRWAGAGAAFRKTTHVVQCSTALRIRLANVQLHLLASCKLQ